MSETYPEVGDAGPFLRGEYQCYPRWSKVDIEASATYTRLDPENFLGGSETRNRTGAELGLLRWEEGWGLEFAAQEAGDCLATCYAGDIAVAVPRGNADLQISLTCAEEEYADPPGGRTRAEGRKVVFTASVEPHDAQAGLGQAGPAGETGWESGDQTYTETRAPFEPVVKSLEELDAGTAVEFTGTFTSVLTTPSATVTVTSAVLLKVRFYRD